MITEINFFKTHFCPKIQHVGRTMFILETVAEGVQTVSAIYALGEVFSVKFKQPESENSLRKQLTHLNMSYLSGNVSKITESVYH